jgi:uncharacterized caspase-like protein
MVYWVGLLLKFSLLILIGVAGVSASALADKRVALVVGNSAYRNVARLDNPRNDAKLMADTLHGLGFSLIGNEAQIDLDKTALDGALQRYSKQIQGADVALFYYAGHGVQVRGSNYLVPVDANPTREADLDFQMVDIALVLRQMEGSGTKLNLVILDACRNNPFGGRGLRDSAGGLAQMRAPEGTLISYATQPGSVAQDGADGNSPYTKALAQTIRKAGLDIFQTFNEVGLAVMQATGDAQQPWVAASPIRGTFYFTSAPASSAATAAPSASPEPAAKEARLTNSTDPLRRDRASPAGPAKLLNDVYSWSQNVAMAPFGDSRQQAGTALATDGKGRVWLSFIDAAYQKTSLGDWIAWPRSLRLYMSTDGGESFNLEPSLTENGGNPALATDAAGQIYATYDDYVDHEQHTSAVSNQRIVLRQLDSQQAPNEACLLREGTTKQAGPNVHVGRDDIIHVVGLDTSYPPDTRGQLLYARSVDNGKTCLSQRRLLGIGPLPQVLDTQSSLLVVGPVGYYSSSDHGLSFSGRIARAFGADLARSALSPDRTTAYVVGDSTGGGLRIHVTADGGASWKITRVDDAAHATAWRYPAVQVDRNGRVQVVWMDDRAGFGAIYHAYSDDAGAHFSANTRVSDKPFRFPANAPPPPPATQDGTWVGAYLSLTTIRGRVIVAWSDQRAGTPKSVVQIALGSPSGSNPTPLPPPAGSPSSALTSSPLTSPPATAVPQPPVRLMPRPMAIPQRRSPPPAPPSLQPRRRVD